MKHTFLLILELKLNKQKLIITNNNNNDAIRSFDVCISINAGEINK